MSKELIERLRTHNDDRLYFEADVLMAEAADLIENQQSWIASLEQNARDADRMYKELEGELAASQAQIKVLREALDFVLNGSTELDQRASIDKARKALNQPTDDSALHEMLKAERERCAKVADADGWGQAGVRIAREIRAMEDQ